MKAVIGLAIGIVFELLFLGAGTSALQGHIGLLLGSLGGVAIAWRAFAAA